MLLICEFITKTTPPKCISSVYLNYKKTQHNYALSLSPKASDLNRSIQFAITQ